jgi:hypothetical protein
LDAILRVHSDLASCAVLCRHCGIRFLTHPRNAGRTNLRCPFGCRQHHRRQGAQQRCAAYRQTPDGKRLKKLLNGRRGVHGGDGGEPVAPCPAATADTITVCAISASEPSPFDRSLTIELRLDDVILRESTVINSPVLPYVRMIVRLIDGIHVSIKELVELLLRSMRQHGIVYQGGVDYRLRFLHQHPP